MSWNVSYAEACQFIEALKAANAIEDAELKSMTLVEILTNI